MKSVMDETAEEFYMEEDDLFGVPQSINSYGGSTILRNDPMQDWRNSDLSQWFDGTIDATGSHDAAVVHGAGLDNDPPQTFIPWSEIQEPVVLTRGNPYRIGTCDTSYGVNELPLSAFNAAERLQLPSPSGHAAAYADNWSSTPAHASILAADPISPGANSTELGIEVLTGGVMNTSLQGGDMECEEARPRGAASHAGYNASSPSYPKSMVEFSFQYAGMLQPPNQREAGNPQNMVDILMQSAGTMQLPSRLGAGRIARKKMVHKWWEHGNSTFVMPDISKMREDRDMMMAREPGPCDILQPMQRVLQPGGSCWALQLLNLCAGAIAERNIQRTEHLMWVLNELASFTGDANERLAAYVLKALFCRITQGTSEASYLRPFHNQEKLLGPKAVHKALVTFHEKNPWHQFAYTVTNEALMDVFAGKSHLHIVDIGLMKGLQWPTLIDALANRPGGPPAKLRITTIRHHDQWAPYSNYDAVDAESADFMRRLVTFAKVLGFNCELNMYAGPLERFREEDLKLEKGEVNAQLNSLVHSVNTFPYAVSAMVLNLILYVVSCACKQTLAVCCQFRLHRLTNLVSPQARQRNPHRTPRDDFLDFVHTLKPSMLVVSENDADMLSDDFATRFREVLRLWWCFFESTDLGFKGKEPNDRGIVEYEGSMICQNAIVCEGRERIERNDTQANWLKYIRRAGFVPVPISEDIKKAVKLQLQRTDCSDHWSVSYSALGTTNCVNLMWKEHTATFSSLWKTPTCSRKLCKCSMLHD